MKLKVTKKKARCKKVLAVLNNKIVTLDFIREDTYPTYGDFEDANKTYAVVKEEGYPMEILIHISCVIFLKD